MKFRYKKYSPQVLRPVIPIKVINQDKSIWYEVLIDSGADVNLFDAKVGKNIGLKLETGEKSYIVGITGKPKPYWIHKISLRVGRRVMRNIFDLLKQKIDLSIRQDPRKS